MAMTLAQPPLPPKYGIPANGGNAHLGLNRSIGLLLGLARNMVSRDSTETA